MNLENANALSNNKRLSTFKNKVSNFLNELKESINKSQDHTEQPINNSQNKNVGIVKGLEQGKTYVLNGIMENWARVVDIENGNEIEFNIATDGQKFNNGLPTYKMDKYDFYNLTTADNIILNGDKLSRNNDDIYIPSDKAFYKLEDTYFCRKTMEDTDLKVDNIDGDRIYLTNADGSGSYFHIYKEIYPDFKVGDIVKVHKGKFYKK